MFLRLSFLKAGVIAFRIVTASFDPVLPSLHLLLLFLVRQLLFSSLSDPSSLPRRSKASLLYLPPLPPLPTPFPFELVFFFCSEFFTHVPFSPSGSCLYIAFFYYRSLRTPLLPVVWFGFGSPCGICLPCNTLYFLCPFHVFLHDFLLFYVLYPSDRGVLSLKSRLPFHLNSSTTAVFFLDPPPPPATFVE